MFYIINFVLELAGLGAIGYLTFLAVSAASRYEPFEEVIKFRQGFVPPGKTHAKDVCPLRDGGPGLHAPVKIWADEVYCARMLAKPVLRDSVALALNQLSDHPQFVPTPGFRVWTDCCDVPTEHGVLVGRLGLWLCIQFDIPGVNTVQIYWPWHCPAPDGPGPPLSHTLGRQWALSAPDHYHGHLAPVRNPSYAIQVPAGGIVLFDPVGGYKGGQHRYHTGERIKEVRPASILLPIAADEDVGAYPDLVVQYSDIAHLLEGRDLTSTSGLDSPPASPEVDSGSEDISRPLTPSSELSYLDTEIPVVSGLTDPLLPPVDVMASPDRKSVV